MILVLIVVVVIVLWAVATYNGLIGLRVRSENAWSDINVQLKRRYDLIPNIVETVKGYASHEQKVFQQVTEARSRAMGASTPGEKGAAESALAGSLRGLIAIAENYPQLRANENFLGLQKSLTEIEEAVQSARRYYNAVVRDFNTKTQVLPDALIANIGGFKAKEFFQLDSPDEAKNPKVSFT